MRWRMLAFVRPVRPRPLFARPALLVFFA